MVYPFFSIMALHGGGHLELKKMHKGDFWGIFGIRLGRCPCIIREKISFLQFYSRFNPNALALEGAVAPTLLLACHFSEPPLAIAYIYSVYDLSSCRQN